MKRKELRDKLAPLRSSSKPFLVEACGVRLEMRVLSNDDAQAIQQMVIDYGRMEVDESDPEAADKQYRQLSAELQHHMKVETIARAIVSINGMRDIVVTADDESGGKVELRDFLREEVGDWDRPVTEEIYTAYGLKALKEEISGALQVKYDPVDFSLEILRLEKLLDRARRGHEEQQRVLQERVTETQELADIEKAGGPVPPAPEVPPEAPEKADADPAVFGGAPERSVAPERPVAHDSSDIRRIPRDSLLAPPPGRGGVQPQDPAVPMHLGGGSFLGDDTSAAIEEAERQQVAMRMRRRPAAPVDRGAGSLEGEDPLVSLRGVTLPGQTQPVRRPAEQSAPSSAPPKGEVRLPANLPVNQRPGDGAINPRFRGR